MASEKKQKKEKEIALEFDNLARDIRNQLNEQVRCLENRLETQVAMVTELQDFLRKKAEVESEYARNLEKLVKNTKLRHRQEKQKREHWSLFSTFTCWQQLLEITKKESRDHNTLSEIYSNQMMQRLGDIMENSQRIFRSCREIGLESHEDIMKTLTELQSAMKTYHTYQTESKQAESKLRQVESQKMKLEQQLQGKNVTNNRKLKSFTRQTEKKQSKYSENKLKALKARNDYLLCIEAANSSINKYFADDISDLLDCMDFGFHNSVRCAMLLHQSCHKGVSKSHLTATEIMQKCVSDLDAQSDKQRFIELHNAAFMLPKKFEFQPCKGDELQQISAQKPVQDDILQRYKAIGERLVNLRLDNDETWKTLEATEKSLNEVINVKDYDISHQFIDENPPPKSPHEASKRRGDRLELETFYIGKFRIYTLSCNQIARLQSKYSAIQKALGDNISMSGRPPSLPPKPKKRRIGRSQLVGQPKLFGGSLEEYCDATSQEIPVVIKSCIRAINLYGMHHQGIFRVSGAQVEINEFKAEFEKGEDPLIDVDPSDINSVAGVLKLYFRELREPLFPLPLFDELISVSKLEDHLRVEKIKELLSPLHRCIIVVMRYLFSFLNHLSEYSDENMMDAYNLAICFGPTLLPIPSDRDQVSYQSNVHEVIKTIIMHSEETFLNDGGEVYEKCILEDSRDSEDVTEGEDDTNSQHSDEDDDEDDDDDAQIFEAVALYDFSGRTERELSFRKGDSLLVYTRVSSDWWDGICNGREGLLPDRYIALKHPPEERKSQTDDDKISSISSLTIKSEKLPRNSLEESPLEKSVSQPNIAVRDANSPPEGSPPPSLSQAPLSSVGSKDTPVTSVPPLVSKSTNESPPRDDFKPSIRYEMKRQLSTPEVITEELTADIDSALAEVVSGLRSLEMQQQTDKRMSLPHIKPKPTAKHTPDLVLDLPAEGANISPQEGGEPDSPTTTADTFAQSNQGTLKKANSMPRNISALPGTTQFGDSSSKEVKVETGFVAPNLKLSTFNATKKVGMTVSSRPHEPLTDSLSSRPHDPMTDSLTSKSRDPMTESLTSTSSMSSSISSSMTSSVSVPPVVPPSMPQLVHQARHPTPPPVAEKPRIPAKVKPPVMKKPSRSPEVTRRHPPASTQPVDSHQ